MKLLKMSLACLIVFFSLGHAASLMEEKLNLEKSIQGNVERLVEKIIGSNEMVVLVNVDLGEEAAKSEGGKLLYPGQAMTEEEYLPGVTYNSVPFAAGSSAKGITIKKITVLVTIDQKINEAIATRIKKEVQELIGLDSIRGDVVNVQKIAFAKSNFTLQEYIQNNWIKQAYWIIVILVLGIFLFGPMRLFFKSILRTVEMKVTSDARMRNSEIGGGGGGGGANPVMAGQLQLGGVVNMAGAQSKDGADKDKVNHFSFVNKENLKNLVYLAKKDTPENIAIIINYLSSPN